jgi:hypothetical protein
MTAFLTADAIVAAVGRQHRILELRDRMIAIGRLEYDLACERGRINTELGILTEGDGRE